MVERTESSQPPSRHHPTPKEGESEHDDSPNPTVPSRRNSGEKESLLINEPEPVAIAIVMPLTTKSVPEKEKPVEVGSPLLNTSPPVEEMPFVLTADL